MSPAVPKICIRQRLICNDAVWDTLIFPKSGTTSPTVDIRSLHSEAGGSLAHSLKPPRVPGGQYVAVTKTAGSSFLLFLDVNLNFFSDYNWNFFVDFLACPFLAYIS